MTCPVCGLENGSGVCGRCGTDVLALRGDAGPPRLDVREVRRLRHRPAPSLR